MSDELTPITRKEIFLAKAGGQNVVTPTPITREETFLQAIIDSGSGGGGGTGGGALIATLNMRTRALDKTWNEINNADVAYISVSDSGMIMMMFVSLINQAELGYVVGAVGIHPESGITTFQFMADSADGYPVMQM